MFRRLRRTRLNRNLPSGKNELTNNGKARFIMSQVATTGASSRELALARRKAMSAGGKAALQSTDRTAAQAGGSQSATGSAPRSVPTRSASVAPASTPGGSARSASLARRQAMSSRGKAGVSSRDRTRVAPESREQPVQAQPASAEPQKKDCGCGCGGQREEVVAPQTSSNRDARRSAKARAVRRPAVQGSTAKIAAMARRQAMSTRGKAGLNGGSMSEAQAARAGNPRLSGRELAQAIREQRSRRGGAGQKKSAPTGRQRKSQQAATGAAQDAPWKVGASETTSGQTVTGTMVGRKENMTGDEASTCRAVTGTEYMGADIFNKFCQADASPTTAKKVMVTSTSHGNAVSGNRMGRASNVTGNEPGTCKNVTGNEYISAEQSQAYCGEFAQKSPRKVSMVETMKGKSVTGNNVGRSQAVTGDEYGMRQSLTGTQYTRPSEIGNAPAKVGKSETLRGGSVTGSMVGRREKMTGDEPGSCKNVTGDDYIGKEQFSSFCGTTPVADDRKVGVSKTLAGKNVTGSLADRSQRVTGNEPGTCKAVTGTPYAGGDQYQQYCKPEQVAEAQARMPAKRSSWGKPMTGQQPAVGGAMTGDAKGACEAVSGTPYVGADQAAEACPAMAAEPGSPDFPQALGTTPWGDFSIESVSHAAQREIASSSVTGSQYENGHITGPFGMATGKVTGTEQARFDRAPQAPVQVAETAESIHGRIKSRITGEGMDAGSRITGDDWERGDRVTGTEGASATRRNPTLRTGPMNAMRAPLERPQDVPVPISKVTGGSGNTENGSLITYSGGARG